jgi:hypothetical protein
MGVLTQLLSGMQRVLPMPLLGLDTDNDTVFMNECVFHVHLATDSMSIWPAIP